MEASTLLMYLAALAGVYLLPGPDMALVIATGATRGRRTALVIALGIALSRAMHVFLSGVGLAALLAAHPRMLDVVRWIGAIYLCFIAIQLLRSDMRPAPASQDGQPAGSFLLRGFLTNLLNPKALLFCSLFLPQFVSVSRGPVLLQYLVLGVILVLVGLAFDMAFALSAARIGKRVKTPSRFGKFVLPAVFVLLAGRLVAS
jgi:threonine/homoserine/homoserine lactone efflux protein